MTWRPTWAEVDLGAVRHNCGVLRSLLAPGTKHLAVVKANAYGHGDVQVARACLEAGVDWLGVALVEEGVRLREAGIDCPVLVLFEPLAPAARELVAWDLVPTVYTRESAEAVSAAAVAAGTTHPVQVAVDTGMHREGVPAPEALELIRHVAKLPGLRLQGLWTHLAVADEEGNPATDRQLRCFAELCQRVEAEGMQLELRHAANSAATLTRPEAHLDMVRTGITLYGLLPAPWLRGRVDLRPAMRLVSHVSHVRRVAAGEGISYGLTYAPRQEATVATVPIGYGDGFSRLLSNRGEVLIHGRRRPIAGRVTMDQFMVDCGDDPVAPGDEVVLLGPQRGPDGRADEITADEVAERIGTVNYEVVCAVGARVPRVFRG